MYTLNVVFIMGFIQYAHKKVCEQSENNKRQQKSIIRANQAQTQTQPLKNNQNYF